MKKEVERKVENLKNSVKKMNGKKVRQMKEVKCKRLRGKEIDFRKEFEQKVEEK